jgi:flagellar biosynthesis/type III secretory pathway protein FliH
MGRLVKSVGRVVPAEVLSAREEAGRIVAEARDRAAAVRELAEREGREAGVAAVTEHLLAAQAQSAAVEARAKEAAWVLARRMAEKIVGRAVELSTDVQAQIIAGALAASHVRTGPVVLRVHPDDLAAVEATRSTWGVAVEVRLVADEAVGRHGCVVETPAGRLDARLETQLAALERAIRK